jgi:hypothetical protein
VTGPVPLHTVVPERAHAQTPEPADRQAHGCRVRFIDDENYRSLARSTALSRGRKIPGCLPKPGYYRGTKVLHEIGNAFLL